MSSNTFNGWGDLVDQPSTKRWRNCGTPSCKNKCSGRGVFLCRPCADEREYWERQRIVRTQGKRYRERFRQKHRTLTEIRKEWRND